MQFFTLLASAQAMSIFNLLPAAFEESIELVFGDNTAHSQSSKLPVPGNTTVEICEAGRPQLLNITELNLTPALPVGGENLTIEATATLLGNVTEGSYVDVFVKYGLINLVKQRYDLCTYLPEVGYECPVEAGEITINKTIEMPLTIPPGEYLVIAKAYNVEEELLTCLFTDVVLGA